MQSRRLAKLLLVWTVVCIVLVGAALATSEGEPVCEGPLILGVDDSDPPQCEDPIAGLPSLAPFILIAGVVITGVFAVVFDGGRRALAARRGSG